MISFYVCNKLESKLCHGLAKSWVYYAHQILQISTYGDIVVTPPVTLLEFTPDCLLPCLNWYKTYVAVLSNLGKCKNISLIGIVN